MPKNPITRLLTAIVVSLSILHIGCRKEKYTYAKSIEGTYNWHHTYNTSRSGYGNTSGQAPDETFDVQERNKKQIAIKGQVLGLTSVDDNYVHFEHKEGSGLLSRELVYNKTTGTLVYNVWGHVSAGSNSMDTYTSY